MKTLQILLLEDSPLDAELIQTNLAEGDWDCHLVRVETRNDFLNALETHAFGLILADYSLPEFDGISALEIAHDFCPEVPFIFVSATLGEELAIETLKSGATDYVLKQRLGRLVPSVRRALREREERAQRQRMEQELHRRNQESLALVENSPDVISRFDLNLRHVYINPAIEAAIGMLPQDFLGKTHAELEIPEDQCRRWQDNLREIFATGLERTIEFDAPAPDGMVKSYQARMVPEFAQDGSVEFVLCVARDITEREQLMRREQTARAEAEAASRVKDEFLAVLSHELRTPLNSILGWAQLLRTRQFSQAKVEQALEVIERNARLQTQLIEDLIDVSRILRGKLSLSVDPVNLASLLQATVDTMHLAAQAKAIQVQLALDSDIGMVLGDSNRLQQVFWNLLSNGIKFTPAGGRIDIRLKSVDSQAQIQFIDTGKGISTDFLPYIFEYFRQAEASTTRKNGGLGLGLAIARHLVEMHGGTIQAESAGEGQGSTFTVRLPLLILKASKGAERSESRAPAKKLEQGSRGEGNDNPLSLTGLKVLVVDDESDTCELIALVLEEYGAEAIAVASADEALESLKQFNPDVLISDIRMPEKDCYLLLRQVRSLPPDQGGRIQAIALTAFAREEDSQEALSAGFQMHVPKPVDPDELVTAVQSLVQQAEVP